MNKRIKLITFDLDNTLWPIEPVIVAAETVSQEWLNSEHSIVNAKLDHEALQSIRIDTYKSNPDLQHNFTALRKLTLENIFLAVGYSLADASNHAQTGFEVFHQARNTVNFFPHAISVLEGLNEDYHLASLTNGNADINQIGLDHLFSAHFSAENVGYPKPHRAMFDEALKHFEVGEHQTIHIGDDPKQDIAAACELGLRTVWVNIDKAPWPENLAEKPDAQVNCLSELRREVAILDNS